MLASAKGSPGVTTAALGLTSWWPREVVLVEADPAGGDLAARVGLAEEPGLVGLAAALRRDRHGVPLNGEVLERHLQEARFGAKVVVGPAGAQQASAAVSLLAAQAARPAPVGDLLMDVGRMTGQRRSDEGLAVRQLTRAADLVVWVCRPELADLAHLAGALGHEQSDDSEVVIVLCGDGPYPADEVAATLDRSVLGPLPADSAGAAALWAGGARSWAHSALGRATRDLAGALAALVAQDSDEGAGESGDSASPPTSTDEPEAHDHDHDHDHRAVAEPMGSRG